MSMGKFKRRGIERKIQNYAKLDGKKHRIRWGKNQMEKSTKLDGKKIRWKKAPNQMEEKTARIYNIKSFNRFAKYCLY